MRHAILISAAVLLVPGCKQADETSVEASLSLSEANTETLADDRRVLDLEGGVNFRDIGGYRTADGRQVKWRKVYRSGSPGGLTPADVKKLEALGIRTVCDLRSTAVRAREPNPFVKANSEVDYLTRDYQDVVGAGDLKRILSGPHASPAQTRRTMIEMYGTIAEHYAESYRQIFRSLTEGRTPLAFNCSAGKDRAGIGTALISSLLGVPRDAVVADYVLSDKIVDYRAQVQNGKGGASALGKLPWETVEPLLASDPAYMEAALAMLDKKYGSVGNFIEKQLGVTPEMRERIRADLLEPIPNV